MSRGGDSSAPNHADENKWMGALSRHDNPVGTPNSRENFQGYSRVVNRFEGPVGAGESIKFGISSRIVV